MPQICPSGCYLFELLAYTIWYTTNLIPFFYYSIHAFSPYILSCLNEFLSYFILVAHFDNSAFYFKFHCLNAVHFIVQYNFYLTKKVWKDLFPITSITCMVSLLKHPIIVFNKQG